MGPILADWEAVMLPRFAKKLLADYLASRGLYITPSLQRSSDQWADIDKAFGRHSFRNFVDVGANIGKSVDAMLRFRPNARIRAIEPNLET